MKNKLKKIAIFLIFLFIFLFTGLKISERIIVRKVSNLPSQKVKIKSINLSFSGVKVREINFKNKKFFVFLKELKLTPVFPINAFAFSGPGEIIRENRKRKINLKGRISGSIKGGNITIGKTEIEIEKIGNIEVKGKIENWGKDYVKTDFRFNGTEIKEIGEFLSLKIPIDGRIYGTAELIRVKGKQEIKFNLLIKEINFEEKENLSMALKGKYDIQKQKVEIEEGRVYGKGGEEIEFNGYVDKENFELEFETRGMSVETLLHFIPEEIRKKYNISLEGGKLSMEKFVLRKRKKNSTGTGNST